MNITLPQLKAGDRDNPPDRMVHRLQGLLTALGSAVTIDGVFGPNTEAAVKHHQNASGLAQNGVVDENTWVMLIVGAGIGPTSPPEAGMPAPKWG